MSYTKEMEQVVTEAAPLDLESAKVVGEKIGKSYRSVIAKAKQLGLEYVAKPVPARKPKEVTKAELVAQLEGVYKQSLAGLEKSPKGVLVTLLEVATEKWGAPEA